MRTEHSADVFVRRLKQSMEDNHRYTFFLGAGCSISSGIPGASDLVKQWLPQLKQIETGTPDDCETWAESTYAYDRNAPAKVYAQIMAKRFHHETERQMEIERLVADKYPGYGYAVFAGLLGHKEKWGEFSNRVLTTNFDHLVADALYLFSAIKPLVIGHESLSGFIKQSRKSPLVVKVHGDAQFAPMNTEIETKQLAESLAEKVQSIVSEGGIIFLGYGGNDESIAQALAKIPSLRAPAFWVNTSPPGNPILAEWLSKQNAIWVKHSDFDRLMLLMQKHFDLPMPDERRHSPAFENVRATFQTLQKSVRPSNAPAPANESEQALQSALDEAVEKAQNSWWGVELEAQKYKKSDPEKAQSVYLDGLNRFQESAELHNGFALFLRHYMFNFTDAEKHYLKALEINPDFTPAMLNYAVFCAVIKKDHAKAEELTNLAIALDESGFHTLTVTGYCSYKNGNITKARKYFQKAVDEHPSNADAYLAYASFFKVMKEDEASRNMYEIAIKLDPDDVNTRINYAGFLFAIGQIGEAWEELSKIDTSGAPIAAAAEVQFYIYAHSKDREKKEIAIKELKHSFIARGVRSPGFYLKRNVERAEKDNHPQAKLVKALADVISMEEDETILQTFPVWKSI
jgi:Tfp pilus assembly protein PilF